MAGTGERAVVVLTPAGGHFTARVSPGDTTWTLKERLEVDVGRPARSMRLIQGEEVLEDEWALLERGLADGARLTLVLSDLPVGTFELRPRNAGASVLAVFESTGRVAVQVHESERTSDSEDEHYDPYARRAAWAQCYFGSCRQGTAGKLVIAVSHCARTGVFKEEEPQELLAEACEGDEELRLQLPCPAGGCKQGAAGLCWVTLQRTHIIADGRSEGPGCGAKRARTVE
uniref:Ubiquitin-like domain-containing protein n=1 Tax=Alexandrium monilatum TaxID=311494 RepID=A0A7S4VDW0_9DINO